MIHPFQQKKNAYDFKCRSLIAPIRSMRLFLISFLSEAIPYSAAEKSAAITVLNHLCVNEGLAPF